jgi:hypothetical protein
MAAIFTILKDLQRSMACILIPIITGERQSTKSKFTGKLQKQLQVPNKKILGRRTIMSLESWSPDQTYGGKRRK